MVMEFLIDILLISDTAFLDILPKHYVCVEK